jgi:hypothetical protein
MKYILISILVAHLNLTNIPFEALQFRKNRIILHV